MFRHVALTVFFACISAVPILDHRIIGGMNTSIENYPHQVSVRFHGYHYCGGSIFKANVVVTAAHCAGLRASVYTVVAGTSFRFGTGVSKKLSKIHIHPDYDNTTLKNDVALLILSSKFKFTGSIQPIALVSSVPASGSSVSVTGWGTTSEGGDLADVLQVVDVNIVSNDDCRKALQRDITSSMLCAGVIGGGKDSCQGDSGGPMILNGKLVGIVSWGYGCAQPHFPAVYANVATLKSWIEANS